jgi:hypothetical protein
MSWQVSLEATLADGVLTLNRRHLQDALRGRQAGPVRILIEPLKATRSAKVNALYWAVYVKALCEHTGYTEDEMHEVLKAKFLPKHVAIADGNGVIVDELVIGGSSRKLNIEDFSAYLEQIQAWAADKLGVIIPEADERVIS